MKVRRLITIGCTLAVSAGALASSLGANAGIARGSFRETDLVSNIPGRAQHTDPNLVNPWGISNGAATPMWVSDNGAGVTTLYRGDGSKVPLTVTIPPAAGPTACSPGCPTGTVFNGNPSEFRGDRFLFATEDGTIAGWQFSDGVMAKTQVDRSAVGQGAVYKALAIGNNGTGDHIYAANFRFATIEVFDAGYQMVALGGSFTDPTIPAGFAPFNIQNLGGVLFVSYAKQDASKHDDVAGPGNGFVDVFDLNGNLMRRFASGGTLNSPWGLEIAPSTFGNFHNNVLVGNFGDGRINAFDLSSGRLRGQLKSETNAPIEIDGLWALRVGNGGPAPNGGDPNAVYFTAGINDEQDGLFGTIKFVDN
jgi:uncharacterized protein (TIGR03118 family)